MDYFMIVITSRLSDIIEFDWINLLGSIKENAISPSVIIWDNFAKEEE